jgi:hypothetical protein
MLAMTNIFLFLLMILTGGLALLFAQIFWKSLFVSKSRLADLSSWSGSVFGLLSGKGTPLNAKLQPFQGCGIAKSRGGSWIPQRRLADEVVDSLHDR